MQVCRATSGWRSWRLGMRISWPTACPPQIRVFVVCLCSLSDEFNSSHGHLGVLTAIGTLSHHRAYLGVGGAFLLVMECSSMRAENGHLSRDGSICRRQFQYNYAYTQCHAYPQCHAFRIPKRRAARFLRGTPQTAAALLALVVHH